MKRQIVRLKNCAVTAQCNKAPILCDNDWLIGHIAKLTQARGSPGEAKSFINSKHLYFKMSAPQLR